MNELFYIIAELVGGLLCILFALVLPKLKAWLSASIGVAETEKLNSLILTLVKTAQQLYWNKSGEERKQFVLEKLNEFGYEYTDYINGQIEAAVFDIHKE